MTTPLSSRYIHDSLGIAGLRLGEVNFGEIETTVKRGETSVHTRRPWGSFVILRNSRSCSIDQSAAHANLKCKCAEALSSEENEKRQKKRRREKKKMTAHAAPGRDGRSQRLYNDERRYIKGVELSRWGDKEERRAR